MMNLMDGGPLRGRTPKRENLEMAGLTALSVTGALILLPIIGLKALASRLPFVKNANGRQQEPDSYLIT
ncbi:hypothetical protein FBY31_1789 [Arthrobacter sp. SLBN-100]|uniref:hypothetical protein n=1 Tax=Arthrobacter sp. SLBN-100 TaxID=2768450 RepID=UPI00115030E5|nr:hypothetical protein [Arthrobacter sp. SLBN-100]TQJ67714.1 hypothetical protein FBY31_1789 [Arthrobacter sp. SLBN-100]